MATSDVGGTCPTVIEYPPEVQAKGADELSAMKPGVVRDLYVPDYGTMRDEARACRGEEPTS